MKTLTSKLVSLVNKFIENKELNSLEKEMILMINDMVVLNKNIDEDWEYRYFQLEQQLQYYCVFIKCTEFIDFFEISKFSQGFFNIYFMEWFLRHTDELKRRLTIDEFVNLNQGYILKTIMYKSINKLSDLHLNI